MRTRPGGSALRSPTWPRSSSWRGSGLLQERAARGEHAHGLDVAVERAILVERRRRPRARSRARARRRRSGAGAALIEPCGGRQDLDRERARTFVDDLRELARADAAHGDVVLLARGRRDRVDARGMAEDLVLADERRARDLRDHEARVQPALRREERREPARERRVDELLDAALADVRELGGGHRREVERERERLAVEVAAARSDRPLAVVARRHVGLSVTLLTSRSSTLRAQASASRVAPCTCGMQRSE